MKKIINDITRIFEQLLNDFKCSFLDIHEPNKMFISKKRNRARCKYCHLKIKLLNNQWISDKRFFNITNDRK